MNPDSDVEKPGFIFVSDFNVFSNNENRVCAPKGKGALLPDNDEVIDLDLTPPTNGDGAFNDVGG